ncbi:hypothetical protein PRIPAC_83011 [Pristionchus pacificus]|uniref:G protein-coupled receptor n=1 Tax=Pristionchus pacificus TaxID=54126 RepID=A0A2A6CLR8_PRIPA|nr:hypothetical protein PRIPAC_83011 [Pristionchus pacificus]|eukprot:PDM78993.1 G protein-coupled receptor [Pristionchus pacificus]
MPIGQAWSDQYGRKQVPFGIYSLLFGITTEILYVPCMIALRKELRSSCKKVSNRVCNQFTGRAQIMFCLSFLDMFAIMVNCVIFGYLLLEGAVHCSNRAMTLAVGIVGYGVWCTASTCCLVLAFNRLFQVLGLSKYFTV